MVRGASWRPLHSRMIYYGLNGMPGHRLSTRLSDYDYRYGTFFVSLVTKNRNCTFGTIMSNKVQLSDEGKIIATEWLRTPLIRPSVQLDEWIVMPDHFQAIAIINNGDVGGASWRPYPLAIQSIPDQTGGEIQPVNRSLARMINQFKATTTRRINEIRGTSCEPVWQRGYHERIIRNDVELDKVRRYIRTNPERG